MPSHRTAYTPGTHTPKRGVKIVPLRAEKGCPTAGLAGPPATSADLADDAELHQLRDVLDHAAHASLARVTGGLSPAALAEAYADWAVHLAISPGKQIELAAKAARKWARLARFASGCATRGGECEPCIEPLPQDRRFAGSEWQKWPYNLLHQAFLLQQQWWHNATTGIDGVTKVPIFVVATERDHVAPWRSVFKIHLLADTEITFLLTTGGHNAGIVSDPTTSGRSYQVLTRGAVSHYLDPDSWIEAAPHHEGSWWLEWIAWLASRSGAAGPVPSLGAPDAGLAALCDAPGTYVLEG
jgi:polyhydroxyalkanoate synthase subunit PhaC